ncbi:MAG: hypothetical protein HGB08_03585 [Candidatus Moranbacteria bacterium]|nr:hypothetical protein [Candidatus Moranbacteria bacterium]
MGIIISSGWAGEPSDLWTRNGAQIREGDLFDEGGVTYLACRNLRTYAMFAGLVPLIGWIDKRIERVEPIVGTNVVFSAGRVLSGNGDARIFRFEGGETGVLFLEGAQVAREPDFELLIKAGMLSQEDRALRDQERELKCSLRKELKILIERRKELQMQLAGAGLINGYRIYSMIKKVEADYLEVKSREEAESIWEGWFFNFDYLTRWIPELADLFDWRLAKKQSSRRVDKMSDPVGKKIIAVHRIFETNGSAHALGDAYALKFEDGNFSVGFGLAESLCLNLSIDGLESAGFISKQQLMEAQALIREERARIEAREAGLRRIEGLCRELEGFDIGMLRTREILQDIEHIRNSLKD